MENEERLFCQSCGMPLVEDKDFGAEKDGSKNTDYCVYCYDKGEFTFECTMEEMIEHNLPFLKEFNEASGTSFDEKQARAEMQAYFPLLKRWKNA